MDLMNKIFIGLAATFALLGGASAQSYSIDWYTIDGGGGTSTGGVYSVSGTIGQHDAGGPMTGGNFFLTGGFWSLYAVQTLDAPLLTITYSGNQAIVSWSPSVTGWTLQTNNNLAPRHLGQLCRPSRKQQRDQCSAQGESVLPLEAVVHLKPEFR